MFLRRKEDTLLHIVLSNEFWDHTIGVIVLLTVSFAPYTIEHCLKNKVKKTHVNGSIVGDKHEVNLGLKLYQF